MTTSGIPLGQLSGSEATNELHRTFKRDARRSGLISIITLVIATLTLLATLYGIFDVYGISRVEIINPFVPILWFSSSLILGFIKYRSLADSLKDKPYSYKLVEFWNDSVNFFIVFLIGYYFYIRWPFLTKGEVLNIVDFLFSIIFILGVFGHLPVLSNNITNGVEAILNRYLNSKT